MESLLRQLLLDGGDKLGDVGVARAFGLVQLLLDKVELLAVGIFQREVFQLALDLIESQSVGQRRIQVGRLGGQADAVVFGHLLP